jgi:hypothetical protein
MLDCMVRIWLFVIGCAILRSKTGSLAGNTSLASLDVFLCSKLTTSAISSYFFPDRGSVWYCSGYQKNPLQQKYTRNVKCFLNILCLVLQRLPKVFIYFLCCSLVLLKSISLTSVTTEIILEMTAKLLTTVRRKQSLRESDGSLFSPDVLVGPVCAEIAFWVGPRPLLSTRSSSSYRRRACSSSSSWSWSHTAQDAIAASGKGRKEHRGR